MISPLHAIDFYKADHRSQYPKETEIVFSNWTARGSRLPGVDKVVFFGLSYYIQEYLQRRWNQDFFERPKEEVCRAYTRRMHNAGLAIEVSHIEALHDLGYLPLEIWALPEGSRVPLSVPMLVLWNTRPEFYWVTNYIETSLSSVLWGPCTSATIAKEYRTILDKAAQQSGGDPDFVQWQGHDFSYRGMYGSEAAALSGAGHLLNFSGTDTVPAIDFLERYYQANSDEEIVGGSVPATEHSVMCMGTQDDELGTFRRLMTEVYPKGIVSIVSDTWDYWKVWTEYLPALKDEILAREGTVTIRPDSGDPVKILVGDPDAPKGSPEHLGSVELAWQVFGGTTTPEGFKKLDPHINLIYGDSITLERCQAICDGLIKKGFVPTCVFGIGSYTYQFNTRDTFGFAIKATAGQVKGQLREIFKDPKTDRGEKKSARGLLAVYEDLDKGFTLKQSASWDEVKSCAFKRVFVDGKLERKETLRDIRDRIRQG